MSIAASIVIGMLWSIGCFSILGYALYKVLGEAEKIKRRRALIKKRRGTHG